MLIYNIIETTTIKLKQFQTNNRQEGIMKYTKQERLHIGGRIYNNEFSKQEAAEQYGITVNTARDYMRMYRDNNLLPAKESARIEPLDSYTKLEQFQSMSKEEFIKELIISRINEARLKKGYEVKGNGARKVFAPLEKENMK